MPFEGRISRLTETITVLRALWSGKPVSHDGKHFAFDDVTLSPAPRNPPAVDVARDRLRTTVERWYGRPFALVSALQATFAGTPAGFRDWLAPYRTRGCGTSSSAPRTRSRGAGSTPSLR